MPHCLCAMSLELKLSLSAVDISWSVCPLPQTAAHQFGVTPADFCHSPDRYNRGRSARDSHITADTRPTQTPVTLTTDERS